MDPEERRHQEMLARDQRRSAERVASAIEGQSQARIKELDDLAKGNYAPDDPRLVAVVDLVGRTGASEFSFRYSDDEEPVIWMATAKWGEAYEAAGAMTPLRAGMRLLETVLDGVGTCTHCGKTSGVSDDWEHRMPLDKLVCWYVYDPETQRFRRSCEGETTGRQFTVDGDGNVVGRNDPCPCESGKKFKRCHGA